MRAVAGHPGARKHREAASPAYRSPATASALVRALTTSNVHTMASGNGDTPRELFLIDGNSLAYRAFFALPESISTSDGRPTNAIFGFASMLVKILTDYGQVPTVVVWDAGMSG